MRHPASEAFHAVLKQLGDLHDKKQLDYGTSSDPFHNVRSAGEWNIDPWVGAMVRASDKIRRLQSYNNNGMLANEGVEDAFMDLAVYAIIALLLHRGK